MADLNARIPDFNLPIINPRTGQMDPVWFQFFLKLFDRTGGSNGGDDPGLVIALSAQALLNSTTPIPSGISAIQDALAQLQTVVIQQKAQATELGNVAVHGEQTDPELHALVTTALDGFMSAADKVKLNGITGGAAVASVSGTAPIVSSGGTTPAISITAATGAAAGSMSAADKTKLDSLISGLMASIIASVTTTNSTADANILSLVVPANTFIAGSVLEARLMADISGAAAGGNLSIWIKVGATKLHTLTISLPAGATSGIGLRLNMLMTQRSATTMQLSGELVTAQNTLTPIEVITTVLNGFDLSISNTVILGWNWSVANAANIAIAHTALIKQEK